MIFIVIILSSFIYAYTPDWSVNLISQIDGSNFTATGRFFASSGFPSIDQANSNDALMIQSPSYSIPMYTNVTSNLLMVDNRDEMSPGDSKTFEITQNASQEMGGVGTVNETLTWSLTGMSPNMGVTLVDYGDNSTRENIVQSIDLQQSSNYQFEVTNPLGEFRFFDLIVVLEDIINVSVVKATYNVSVDVGDTVEFMINVTNLDDITNLTDIIIFDEFNVSHLNFSGATGSPDLSNVLIGEIEWEINLTADTSYVVYVNFTAISAGNTSNEVIIENLSHDELASDISDVEILEEHGDNLTLSKTVENASVENGSIITFTLNVTNVGDTNVTNYSLWDNYDDVYLDFINETSIPYDEYNENLTDVGWFFDLDVGNSFIVQINFTGISIGNTTNNASVEDDIDEEILTDGIDVEILESHGPEEESVIITKTTLNQSVEVGEVVQFKINITNNGSVNFTDVDYLLADDYNNTFLNFSGIDVGWPPELVNFSAGMIDWGLNLSVGETKILIINFTALQPGNTSNFIFVENASEDELGSDFANVEIIPPAAGIINLTLSKIVVNGSVYNGSKIAFILNVTNIGNVNVTNYSLWDNYDDAYLDFINETSIPYDEYSANLTDVGWFFNLDVGNSFIVQINFTGISTGNTTNNASVENDTDDEILTDVVGVEILEIPAPPTYPLFIGPVVHNGTDNYYHDNETIYFFFNASSVGIAGNATINCSRMGDSDEVLAQNVSGDQINNTFYAASCVVNYTALRELDIPTPCPTQQFTPLSTDNFTITLTNGGGYQNTTTLAGAVIPYNFTYLSTVNPLFRFTSGSTLSTNLQEVDNFNDVNYIIDVEMNNTIIGGDGSGFTNATLFNFTSLDMTDTSIFYQLSFLPTFVSINISQNFNDISYIYVNSTALASFNSSATMTMYNLPFISDPVITTDTGSVNTTVSYENGILVFIVNHFTQYNVQDSTPATINLLYPTNGLTINDSTPEIKIIFNGTGSPVDNDSISIDISSDSIYEYANMTCSYYLSQEGLYCLFNTSDLSNGPYDMTINVTDVVGNAFTSQTTNFTINVPIPQIINLTLSKTVINASVDNGSKVAFILNVTNIGTVNVTNYSLWDNYDDAYLDFINETSIPYDEYSANLTDVGWFFNLDVGNSFFVQINFTGISTGNTTNNASVENDTDDEILTDVVGVEILTPTEEPILNISLVKTRLTQNVSLNDTVEFILNVTNLGNYNWSNYILQDVYSSSKLDFSNANPSYTTLNETTGDIIWSINLPINASYVVNLNLTAITGGNATNWLFAMNDTGGQIAEHKLNFTIAGQPPPTPQNFTIEKTSLSQNITISDVVTFVLNFTNNDNFDYNGFFMSDFYDNTFLGFRNSSPAYDSLNASAGEIVWQVNVPQNTSKLIFVDFNTLNSGTTTNDVYAQDDLGVDIGNNNSTINIAGDLDNITSIKVSKYGKKAQYNVSEIIEYIINITNNGTVNITSLILIDDYNTTNNALNFSDASCILTNHDNVTRDFEINVTNCTQTVLIPNMSIIVYVNFTYSGTPGTPVNATNYVDVFANDTNGNTTFEYDEGIVTIVDVGPDCGDNVSEPPEVCDGTDLNGQQCTDHGYTGGLLGCEPGCGNYSFVNCTSGGGCSQYTNMSECSVGGCFWNGQNETEGICASNMCPCDTTSGCDPDPYDSQWDCGCDLDCGSGGCWQYIDYTSCENDTTCLWKYDFGGQCVEKECWDIILEDDCINASNAGLPCQWNSQGYYCEELGCWQFDNQNEENCSNNTIGLDCEWYSPLCNPKQEGCDDFDGQEADCMSHMCVWDPATSNCSTSTDGPGGPGGGGQNPGCWIFDQSQSACENIIGCTWGSACSGHESDGVSCADINDSTMCNSIPMLSSCCTWSNGTCASAISTSCWDNMQPPPTGADFCEDYNAINNESMCNLIAGSPWYMPCSWDNVSDKCGFNGDNMFSGGPGDFKDLNSETACEAAGGVWNTDSYTEGGVVYTDSWCELGFGFSAASCDSNCWACEFESDGSAWPNASSAQVACEASALGFCQYTTDTNAFNGFGWCNPPMEFSYGGGDCQVNCFDCQFMNDPELECNNSNAGCRWFNDPANVTGGWCDSNKIRSCEQDCTMCDNPVQCSTYGKGGNNTCTFSYTDGCKEVGYTNELCCNGDDDDGDGDIDCEDSDCNSNARCGGDLLGGCPAFMDNTTCSDDPSCAWYGDLQTGYCDFAGAQCFQYSDETGCNSTAGCNWFGQGGDMCDINRTLSQTCFPLNQGACDSSPNCFWNQDPYGGAWCDYIVFECVVNETLGLNQSNCESNSNCRWIEDQYNPNGGFCDPLCFSINNTECASASPTCEVVGGMCEPEMSSKDCPMYDFNNSACANQTHCTWFSNGPGIDDGICNDVLMSQGIVGVDMNNPLTIGTDSCPEVGVNPESDICSAMVNDGSNSFIIGMKVVNTSTSATCDVNGSFSKYYWYLDTDDNTTGNCNNSENTKVGFEFFFKYEAWRSDGDLKESKVAYTCVNGTWAPTCKIKFNVPPSDMICNQLNNSIGGMIFKQDLKKFPSLYDPSAPIRIHLTTANQTTNKTDPTDILDPWYTPGSVDFVPECCTCPGQDLDGDGFDSDNDPDCTDVKRHGYCVLELGPDCIDGEDNDGNGFTDCQDPSCRYDPNFCSTYSFSSLDPNDHIAPQIVCNDYEEFPDSFHIIYSTTEPANATVDFYLSSDCTDGINQTLYDFQYYTADPYDDYTINHDVWIENLDLNTTYGYRIQVCDPSSFCAATRCRNFTTSASTNSSDCSSCSFVMDFDFSTPNGTNATDPLGNLVFSCDWDKDGNFTDDQNDLTYGIQVNYSQAKNVTCKFENPNATDPWSIILYGLDITGSPSSLISNLTNAFLVNETNTSTYLGMGGSKFQAMLQNWGITQYDLLIPVTGDSLYYCDEDNLTSCKDVTGDCTKISGSATFSLWRCPMELGLGFSSYTSGGEIYNLTFENLTATYQDVGVDENATYTINLTNENNVTRVYNMSVDNGTLNVSQINLSAGESELISLVVSDNETGEIESIVYATLYNNASIILNSTPDIGLIVTNVTPDEDVINVTIVKSSDNISVDIDDIIEFKINVTNWDDVTDLTDLSILDEFNTTYLNYSSATGSPDTSNVSNGEIIWDFNLSASTSYVVYVNFTAIFDGNTTNEALVENSSLDEIANDNATVEILDEGHENLTLSKTVESASVDNGSIATFTINVTNTGDGDAENHWLWDMYDDTYLDFNDEVSVNYTEYNDTTNEIGWEFNLSAGNSFVIQINFTTTAVGNTSNNASVENESEDEILSDTADVEILDAHEDEFNLTISKTVESSSVQNGEIVTFTINVTNVGDINATDYAILDIYNTTYLNYTSANDTPDEINYSAGELFWDFNLSIDDSYVVIINFTSLTVGNTTNLAIVENLSEVQVANDTDDVEITVPANNVPIVSNVILNSTSGNNYTTENLTVYLDATDGDNDDIKNITNWYVDGRNIAVFNMPMEAHAGDETAEVLDYSGFDHNASVGNGTSGTEPTWNSTGGVDGKGAYEFDGDDYLFINDSDNLDLLDEISVEAWMKPAETGQNDVGIVAKAFFDYQSGSGDSLYGFIIWSNSAQPIFDGDRLHQNLSGCDINIGTQGVWSHVVITYNTTGTYVYVNGTLDCSSFRNTTEFTGTNTRPLIIGGYVSRGQYSFNGTIDEVMIYNRSLTQEQIIARYQQRADLIVSQETEVNETWRACITPNDETEDGNEVCSNNITILETPVQPVVNLTLSKTVVNNSVYNGSKIVFLLNVTNIGDVNVTDYWLWDDYDDTYLDFNNETSTSYTEYNETTNEIGWTFNLTVNDSYVIEINFTGIAVGNTTNNATVENDSEIQILTDDADVEILEVPAAPQYPLFLSAVTDNGTDDYYSDNETIYFFFNASYVGTAGNATINCSRMGDDEEILASNITGDKINNTLFMASCVVNYTALRELGISTPCPTQQFTPLSTDNFTITLTNGDSLTNTSILSGAVIPYNFTYLATDDPTFRFTSGSTLSTNLQEVDNFADVNYIIHVEMNNTLIGENGSDYTDAALFNFSSLDMTDTSIFYQLSFLPSFVYVNISQDFSDTSYIYVNSTALASFNSSARMTMYNLPFITLPNITTDTGSVNTTVSYENNTLVFIVNHFTQYNVQDSTPATINLLYPTNDQTINDSTPEVKIIFNGTGSPVDNDSISVDITSDGIYQYANMTCSYYLSAEGLYCLFNTSELSNGDYNMTINVTDIPGNAVTSQTTNFTVNVPVAPVVNLTLSKTAVNSSVLNGSGVTFILNVTNVGSINVTDYALWDTYEDTYLDFNNETSINYDEYNETENDIGWFFNLTTGNSYVVYLNFTTVSVGNTTNNASVENDSEDEILTDTANVEILQPASQYTNITVVKTTISSPIFDNQTARFMINITNIGDTNITLENVTDYYSDSEFNYSASSPTANDTTNGNIEWYLNVVLQGGESTVVYLNLTPLTNGTFTNYANVTTEDINGNTSFAQDNSNIIVNPADDLDFDTYNTSTDCDDNNASIWQNITGYPDDDGDNFGNGSDSAVFCTNGTLPVGEVVDNTDCADENASVNPNGTEIVDDGIDSNCDTNELCYVDADDDNFRPNATANVSSADLDCTDSGEAITADPTGDCNDANSSINPNGTEIPYDGIDQDCSGQDLALATNITIEKTTISSPIYDNQTARFMINITNIGESNITLENVTDYYSDSEFNYSASSPTANDTTNGNIEWYLNVVLEANESTVVYLNLTPLTNGTFTNYVNVTTEDIYGNSSFSLDNSNIVVNPADDLDFDTYNNSVDCDDNNASIWLNITGYPDDDGDLFGNGSESTVFCTNGALPPGEVADNTDCNDGNFSIKPNGTEIFADGIDSDCDGNEQCYLDADNDTYGHISANITSTDLDCADSNESSVNTDCDDNDAAEYPGVTWYADSDGDLFGNASSSSSCDRNLGSDVLDNTDCIDTNSSINPNGTEIVNDGIDSNCDTNELCYVDADDDNFRPNATANVSSADLDCTDSGEAITADPTGDCNDANSSINPNGTEIPYDGIDQDCSGQDLGLNTSVSIVKTTLSSPIYDNQTAQFRINITNIGQSNITLENVTDYYSTSEFDYSASSPTANDTTEGNLKWYLDTQLQPSQSLIILLNLTPDANGTFTNNVNVTTEDQYGNLSTGTNSSNIIVNPADDLDFDTYNTSTDCDDNNASIWQNITGYPDDDGDNFGNGSDSAVFCTNGTLPVGEVVDNTDCDDGNSSVNPNGTEIPYDGIDQDCSGQDLEPGTNITVVKTTLASPIAINGTARFRINITNIGESNITLENVTDYYSDSEFNYSASSPTANDTTNGNNEWNLNVVLEANESTVIYLNLTPLTNGTFTNYVNVTTEDIYGNLSFSQDSSSITVNLVPLACGDTITEDTTLNENISHPGTGACITINTDNVTLDCAGYYIDGVDAGGSYGVKVTGNNITVKNCNTIDFANGIYFTNGFNCTAYNNTASSATQSGIRIESDNNTIKSNNFVDVNGAWLAGADNNRFISNQFPAGFYFETPSHNNIFESNTLGLAQIVNSNGTILRDQPMSSYSIVNSGLTIEETGVGTIEFLENVAGSGSNLSSNITISSNNIFINSSATGLNVSAEICPYVSLSASK
ncbi:MopE-related protein [Nanoarchaeota archaeon]